MGEAYWSDEGVTLHLGDCLDVLRTMEPDSIDAIVTDPPAGIAFMDREWDDFRRARNPADAGRDNVFGRTSAHGPEYGRRDRGQFVDMLTERLAEAYRVLKPGGHALVWSIPRTSHWTAWAIEDAGFDIRDCVLHLFGSGFPKSLDVSKAIDKAGGQSVSWFGAWLRAERERRGLTAHELCERGGFYKNVNHGGLVVNWELGLGTPTAAQFNKVCDLLGLDYPRIEVLEREVLGTRAVHPGVAFSSDGPAELEVTAPATEAAVRWEGWGTALKPGQEMWWLARKPLKGTVAANVLEFGTGALNIDGCKVEGPAGDGHWIRNGEMGTRGIYGAGGQAGEDFGSQNPAGGRWPPNILLTHSADCTFEDADDMYQDWCAPDCPVAEMDRQSGVRTSGSRKAGTYGLMGYMGADVAPMPEVSGDTGGASRFFPIFRYQAKAPTSERPRLEDGSAHETVKPLGLVRWLVRLVTPPGGTVADMFAGSGPTAEACIIEGFRCILIEQDPKSAELIVKRLSKPIQPLMFGMEGSAPAAPSRRVAASKPKPVPEVHATLFDEAS